MTIRTRSLASPSVRDGRMSRRKQGVLACAVALTALCLSGCVTLFPKAKPAQLYRFGADAAETPAAPAKAAASFTVRALPVTIDSPADGDRILTVAGDGTAFIAGARWVTSASALFDSAVARAFEAHATQARLLAVGEPSAADYALKIDVRTFEARYSRGSGAPPMIVVEAYAALVNRQDAQNATRRLFQATAPAASNSVHAIAAAFDQAVAKVLGDLVGWVDAKGAA
jgi:cholesterol transport system auxiliary component